MKMPLFNSQPNIDPLKVVPETDLDVQATLAVDFPGDITGKALWNIYLIFRQRDNLSPTEAWIKLLDHMITLYKRS